MISQRDGVIAELRDEAYTLWASGWLAFRRRAAKAFSGLDFNLQVPDEEEAEESVFEDEADPEVFFDTPSLVPLPGEAEIPTEAGSSPRLLGLRLLTRTTWRLAPVRLLVALPPTSRPLCIIFAHSG